MNLHRLMVVLCLLMLTLGLMLGGCQKKEEAATEEQPATQTEEQSAATEEQPAAETDTAAAAEEQPNQQQ
jgi:hypothetical protein